MLNAGNNLKKINDTTLQTILPVNKEGYLFYITYAKGNESKVSFNLICVFNEDSSERYLSETDKDGNIVKWERYLTTGLDTIYPVRLPGNCDSFKLIVNFIGGDTGIITIGCKANSFYN